MRLWSLHPSYLDARGLVAVWREALLAQAVLQGETKGYMHHPQLVRFRTRRQASAAIASYLRALHDESVARGYDFRASKIGRGGIRGRMVVTGGQLRYEWQHLLAKLRARDPKSWARLAGVRRPRPHPLFRVVPGGVAEWEKVKGR